MQNIDYSRKFRSEPNRFPHSSELPPPYSPSGNDSLSKSLFSVSGEKSILTFLIGAILLFTAGMIVGIQMSQKETQFQEKEFQKFANTSSAKAKAKETFSSAKTDDSAKEMTESRFSFQGIAYPPKEDQINYLIQVGDFEPEIALRKGQDLVRNHPSIKGRVFRTDAGKLFVGFFTEKKEAESILQAIQSSDSDLQEAQLKIQRF